MRNKTLEMVVGVFMIIAFLGLIFLAFKVSGLTVNAAGGTYEITADFDNIGSLKVRAPVQLSGVTVGRIADIGLDPDTFRARVTMQIDNQYNGLPIDTSASIFTQGILGSNYIALTPGFETTNLKQGSRIETTHSALILENLIGQLLFSLKPENKTKEAAAPAAQPAATPAQ